MMFQKIMVNNKRILPYRQMRTKKSFYIYPCTTKTLLGSSGISEETCEPRACLLDQEMVGKGHSTKHYSFGQWLF